MLRNKVGGMAMVSPWPEASEAIARHAGTVVVCIEHGPCGLGGDAWETYPVLRCEHDLVISWDDQDLLPLGDNPDQAEVLRSAVAA